MALHFLVDGYNVIKKVTPLARLPWEEGRASLVRIIENENLPGSVNNELTILFDGRPGRTDTPGTLRVKVAFTGDESADDRIKQIVTDAKNKKFYVVVTDDRDLQYYVRSLGAQVLKVGEFLNKAKSHQDTTHAQEPAGGEPVKVLPKTLQEAITTELEQIWLGKKKK
jgi:predicted RNA-binding protein with PIN domain